MEEFYEKELEYFESLDTIIQVFYYPLKKLALPPFTDPPLTIEELEEIFSLLKLIYDNTSLIKDKLIDFMNTQNNGTSIEKIFLDGFPNMKLYILYHLHYKHSMYVLKNKEQLRSKLGIFLKNFKQHRRAQGRLIEDFIKLPTSRYIEYCKFFRKLSKFSKSNDLSDLLAKFDENQKYFVGANMQIDNIEKHKMLKELIKYSSQQNKNLIYNKTRYYIGECAIKLVCDRELIPVNIFIWDDIFILTEDEEGDSDPITYDGKKIYYVNSVLLKDILVMDEIDKLYLKVNQNERYITLKFMTPQDIKKWKETLEFWVNISKEITLPEKQTENNQNKEKKKEKIKVQTAEKFQQRKIKLFNTKKIFQANSKIGCMVYCVDTVWISVGPNIFIMENNSKFLQLEKIHEANIISMHVKGSFLWAGSQNGDISIWNGSKRTLKTVLKKHKSPVNCISSTTNDCSEENWVFTGDTEGNIYFWNPYGYEHILFNSVELREPVNSILFVQETSTESHLFIGTFKNLHLWNFRKNKIICTWHAHKGRIERMNIVGGNKLITCSSDGMGIWDLKQLLSLATETKPKILQGHLHKVSAIAYMETRSDVLLFSGSWDSTICVWSLKLLEMIEKIQVHNGVLKDFCVTKDYGIFSCGEDGAIFKTKYLDSEEYGEVKTKSGVEKKKTEEVDENKPTIETQLISVEVKKYEDIKLEQGLFMELSPTGTTLYLSNKKGFFGWDIETKQSVFDCSSQINGMMIIPSTETDYWMFTLESNRVGVWYYSEDSKLLAKVTSINTDEYIVNFAPLSFLDDEVMFVGLLIADVSNTVSIWVIENSPKKNFTKIVEIQSETVVYACCHIQNTSNDPGVFLLACSEIIQFFDLKEKKIMGSIQASSESKVDSMLFDKERLLVFTSSNKEVKVWSASNFLSNNTKTTAKKVFIHEKKVTTMCILKEINCLATATINSCIYLWDMIALDCARIIRLDNQVTITSIKGINDIFYCCSNEFVYCNKVNSDKRLNTDQQSIDDENFIRESKSKNQNINFNWKKSYNIFGPTNTPNQSTISKKTSQIMDEQKVSLLKYIVKEESPLKKDRPGNRKKGPPTPNKNLVASTLRNFSEYELDDVEETKKLLVEGTHLKKHEKKNSDPLLLRKEEENKINNGENKEAEEKTNGQDDNNKMNGVDDHHNDIDITNKNIDVRATSDLTLMLEELEEDDDLVEIVDVKDPLHDYEPLEEIVEEKLPQNLKDDVSVLNSLDNAIKDFDGLFDDI